jgi:outer membrane lipoprotein-sorting protein
MKSTFLFLLLSLLMCSVWAQDWKSVATEQDGSLFSYKSTYESKTKQKKATIIKIWIKRDYKSKTIMDENGDDVAIPNASDHTLCEFDCKNRQVRFLEFVLYDGNGRQVEKTTLAPDKITWKTLSVGSVMDQLLNGICADFK